MTAGLKTIIALSFVLAIGFLLVILSSALWHNYLPLLVVATYVMAPLPNWICTRCANPDDFMENSGSALIDFGRFVTGFLVVMGVGTFYVSLRLAGSDCVVYFAAEGTAGGMYGGQGDDRLTSVGLVALPALLAHCALIQYPAMVMSIVGGLLIYGTIISFTTFFQEEQEF